MASVNETRELWGLGPTHPLGPAPGTRSPSSASSRAAAATCTAHNPCTDSPQGALTQLASSPNPLLRADALEAVHLIHAGATGCTWIRGTLINVCRGEGAERGGGVGKSAASRWEGKANRPWPVNVGSCLDSVDPWTEGMGCGQ